MQTEEVKSNGQTEVMPEDNLYKFDAPEIMAEINIGKGVILTHVFRKPTLRNHLDREKAIRRVSRIGRDQDITTENNESDANSEFYNELILRAFARRGGETIAEYDAEVCLGFPYEIKDKAIGQLYTSWVEIEEDDDPLARLFEKDGTITVKQTIGEEDSPSYVLRYTLKIPTRSQRQEYLTGSFQNKRKVEKQKTTIQTVFNLNKGIKLFNAIFEGVEGGRVRAGTFTPELRAEFLNNIDPLFANNIADCAVGYYDQSRD